VPFSLEGLGETEGGGVGGPWLATRDLSYTAKVVTIAEAREAMAAG
jgi:hypothetical protein